MNVNPDWLRYFVALAEAGGFAAAGERLGVSSQAVSKAIAGLEDRFRVKLVERDQRVRGLTPAGEALLAEARALVGRLEDLDRQMAGWKERAIAGPVAIGSAGFWHDYLLPPILAELIARHPRIRPRVHDMLPEDVERWVADGELDLGFLPRPPARPDLLALDAMATPNLIVSAPGPKRAWQELGFVVPRFFRRELPLSLDGWPDDRFPRRIVAEVEMLGTAIQFCEAGLGAALLPELAIREQLAAGRLVVVADPPVPIEERLWIVWRKRVRPRPVAREVLAALGVWREPAEAEPTSPALS